MDSDPCCSPSVQPGVHPCPTCGGRRSRPVDLSTVKAILKEVALHRLEPARYQFCAVPECRTVYFDPASGASFTTTEVSVTVWEKEPSGSRTICYCFGENEADIRHEIEANGSSRAMERIRGHIEAGRCACEVRNPRGVCCLRDVAEAVRRQEGLAEVE